jgi:hypothetical protein
MNIAYMPSSGSTPPPADSFNIKIIGDLLNPDPTKLKVTFQTSSSEASSPIATESMRRTAKNIAWFGFISSLILITTALISLIIGVVWLAALAGTAAIGTYGLLFTAGMQLNALDRKSLMIIRE